MRLSIEQLALILIAITSSSTCFHLSSSKIKGNERAKLACATNKELWSDRVEYIDLSANIEESSNSRSLPLFLLAGAFYPSGTNNLNIFEMKYRTMMFDCANSDDMFGYIHCDQRTGAIAKYGTLCKIVDRQLLEDGRQYIAIEGVGRFKTLKILKTLPYCLAEVEPNIVDKEPESEVEAQKLESEVYNLLKYYMRLMRSLPANNELTISTATKKSRPTGITKLGEDNSSRRTSFSFALANMIQMTRSDESQLLLQTTDVMKRLRAERAILSQAVEMIAAELIKRSILTADTRDGLKMQSVNSEFDEDILPPDVIEDVAVEEKDEWDLSNIM